MNQYMKYLGQVYDLIVKEGTDIHFQIYYFPALWSIIKGWDLLLLHWIMLLSWNQNPVVTKQFILVYVY